MLWLYKLKIFVASGNFDQSVNCFQILCTRFRAKVASLILCLVAISISLHVFWTSGLKDGGRGLDCIRDFRFRYFVSHVASPLTLFLYSFGPSVIMMTCNMMTIVKVCVQSHQTNAKTTLVAHIWRIESNVLAFLRNYWSKVHNGA